jgi:hypothetical protein
MGERKKIDEEHRIRKFKRYVDDSIGIWRGRKEDLERKVRSMEDSRKGIKLKLEVEEKRKIVFLDVEIKRGGREERISTKWFRKKEDSGIMCNWRSDVDSTKRNIVNNLEKKIEKLTTEEGEKKRLKESMWGILRRNGYKKEREEEKKKELRGTQERDERKEEGRWYGLTSMGRYTEKLKGMRRNKDL